MKFQKVVAVAAAVADMATSDMAVVKGLQDLALKALKHFDKVLDRVPNGLKVILLC